MNRLETDRLILREMTVDDESLMFQLNSDVEVQRELRSDCVTTEETREIIKRILIQYEVNGIGRWLVFLKDTNEFLGWAGLKIETCEVYGRTAFVDLGYRILPQYWNKGYMTEAAKALVKYGFETMNYDTICAYIFTENIASAKVLQRAGLKYIGSFQYENESNDWYQISKEEYNKLNENQTTKCS